MQALNVPFNRESFRRSKSNEVIQYREIYDPAPGLKYMPVDLVASPVVKKSIARSLLYSALRTGLVVIKHGRHGKPKKKKDVIGVQDQL